jgi:FAD/FMN-containing dehydrogenase
MAEYQITYWRELPSLVVAREGDVQAKIQLDTRFQEAIDEAAMRLGDTSSGDYLEGWRRDEWVAGQGAPSELVAEVVARLEEQWSPEAVAAFLDGLS